VVWFNTGSSINNSEQGKERIMAWSNPVYIIPCLLICSLFAYGMLKNMNRAARVMCEYHQEHVEPWGWKYELKALFLSLFGPITVLITFAASCIMSGEIRWMWREIDMETFTPSPRQLDLLKTVSFHGLTFRMPAKYRQ